MFLRASRIFRKEPKLYKDAGMEFTDVKNYKKRGFFHLGVALSIAVTLGITYRKQANKELKECHNIYQRHLAIAEEADRVYASRKE